MESSATVPYDITPPSYTSSKNASSLCLPQMDPEVSMSKKKGAGLMGHFMPICGSSTNMFLRQWRTDQILSLRVAISRTRGLVIDLCISHRWAWHECEVSLRSFDRGELEVLENAFCFYIFWHLLRFFTQMTMFDIHLKGHYACASVHCAYLSAWASNTLRMSLFFTFHLCFFHLGLRDGRNKMSSFWTSGTNGWMLWVWHAL